MIRELAKGDPTKCCTLVLHYHGAFYHGRQQCTRKWVVTNNGKHYCQQHDPKKEKEREAVRESKYNYNQALTAMGWVGVPLYDALEKLMSGDASGVKEAKVALAAARRYRRILKEGKRK